MPFTLAHKLALFPPVLVRLLARRGRYGPPLTTDEIAFRAELAPTLVEVISQQVSWDYILVGQAFAFMRGCLVLLEHPQAFRRISTYLDKRPQFSYLRRSKQWHSYYEPLLLKWRKTYGIIKPTDNIWPPIRKLLIYLNPLVQHGPGQVHQS